jgi:hypothetical protein
VVSDDKAIVPVLQERMSPRMNSNCMSKVALLHGFRLVLVKQEYNCPRTAGEGVKSIFDMACSDVSDLSGVNVDLE